MVEDGADALPALSAALFPSSGRAYTVGLTGSPGVGKSFFCPFGGWFSSIVGPAMTFEEAHRAFERAVVGREEREVARP